MLSLCVSLPPDSKGLNPPFLRTYFFVRVDFVSYVVPLSTPSTLESIEQLGKSALSQTYAPRPYGSEAS